MLLVEGVSKSYGDVVALRDVSFDIEPGAIVGLVGPNGAGKTTLLSIIVGILTADRGTVTIAGYDVASQRRHAVKNVGFAAQETGLYPRLTVGRNLQHFARLVGVPWHSARQEVGQVASRLQLDDLLDRRVSDLSGGERRRVHVAAALFGQPRLLLFDEATANVDVDARSDFLAVVRMMAERGAAILFSSHYLVEVEQLGAEVLMLFDGTVRARGSIDDLVRGHGSAQLEVRFDEPPAVLPELPGLRVERRKDGLCISTESGAIDVPAVLASLNDRGLPVTGMDFRPPNLESVYVNLRSEHSDILAGSAGP